MSTPTGLAKPVRVTLQGKTFTLQTEEPEAHIQASAAMVNTRIDDLRRKAALPEGTLAMLVAMELAGELLLSRGTSDRFAPLKLRAERLRDQLAAAIGAAERASPTTKGGTDHGA